MWTKRNNLFLLFPFLFAPLLCAGQVVITEIMYDLDGTDTDREWIEVQNIGTSEVDLTGWKFFEGETNHGLTVAQGGGVVQANGFAVITDVPAKFLIDWSGYAGIVFDSSFSLSNTGERLVIRNADLIDEDEVTYSSDWGAKDDGNSLQLLDNEYGWMSPSGRIAATPTPGAINVSGGAPPPGGQTEATTSQSYSTSEQPSSATSAFPVEPQIFAELKGPKNGIAGADLVFTGTAFGLQKQPLEGARFLWTFGDGAVKEGEVVMHSYFSPGAYVAVLSVSSGKYTASARQTVTIIAPSISMSAIETGTNGFVELRNDAAVELDISNWHIRSAGRAFTMPSNTIILSKKSLRFPNQITGLEPNSSAELLFPNGITASSYAPKPIAVVSAPAPEVKPMPKPTKTVTTSINDSVKDAGADTKNIPAENQTAAVFTGAQEVGVNNTSTSWMWYLLLGGVIVVASLAYWIGGRREEGEFTIIEDRSE